MLHKLPAMKINRRGSGKSGRIIPGKPRQVNSPFQGGAKLSPDNCRNGFRKNDCGYHWWAWMISRNASP